MVLVEAAKSVFTQYELYRDASSAVQQFGKYLDVASDIHLTAMLRFTGGTTRLREGLLLSKNSLHQSSISADPKKILRRKVAYY